MPSKKIEFQDSEFIRVATLNAKSDRLRMDADGRIEEDSALLASFEKLVEELTEAAGRNIRFGQICVVEGAYIADVFGVVGLTNLNDEIAALFSKFEQDVAKLEINAGTDNPVGANGCGVSSASLNVLEASAAMKVDGHVVRVVLADGRDIELSAPSVEAIAALPPQEKRSKKVDGQITGIGWGDDRGFRIEVGRGTSYIASGLTLDHAFGHMRRRANVSGIATWDREGGVYVLENPMYEDTLNI